MSVMAISIQYSGRPVGITIDIPPTGVVDVVLVIVATILVNMLPLSFTLYTMLLITCLFASVGLLEIKNEWREKST